ncbi:MAG: cytochrome ubiquinol oxidase subunit I [Chloroflexi bacterium]|nr:MAG: cytochrome ubiquinol oxidase subunit I [Chloroflexota bacterium]
MSNLIAARVQMGNSLAFHIAFVVLAMGMPLMLCIAEGLALWHKDPVWMAIARRWSKAVAMIFIIGAVSGTVISFELGLLWPSYTQFAGSIIGPLFAFEGIFFFTEAIFLGIYLYGWDRLSPRAHWICSFPIWISGLFAAFIIVTVNSWMNTPTGFVVQNGQITGINSLQAIFNPAQPYEVVHMILASFVGIGFGVATVYAIAILRGKRDAYHRKAMLLGMVVGLVSIPLQMIAGDAMGIPNVPQQSWYTQGLVIPDGLSLLVGFSPDTTVQGLNIVPANDRPDNALIPIIHLAFDLMVLFGSFIMLVAFVFWIIFFVRRSVIPEYKWLLWSIILCGPMAFIAVECGWVVTEEGRQPWVIYNYLRTSEAVTTAPYLNFTFGVFTIIYILMTIMLIILLVRQARTPMPKMEWAEVTRVSPVEKPAV